MPAVSVVIPCFNQEKYIAECFESVLEQTFNDYEVIVVNDGSTDNSLKIIKEYIDKYKNFRLIDQSNHGVVAARNRAIAEATGTYIYPLDADDKIAPDCLEKLYQAMLRGKGDIITSRVLKFGEETGELVLPSPTPCHMAVNNCLVNAALFKKTDFISAGGYDENFSLGLEDYDLWMNMVFYKKLKIYRVQEKLFYYRMKNISDSRNKQQAEHYSSLLNDKLLKKYPQIKRYRIYERILKNFYRISIRDNVRIVKVLGIAVYRYKMD